MYLYKVLLKTYVFNDFDERIILLLMPYNVLSDNDNYNSACYLRTRMKNQALNVKNLFVNTSHFINDYLSFEC